MSKETMRETINTINSVDGMKAVKVAYDLSQSKCGMFGGGKKIYFFIKINSNISICNILNLYLAY